MSERTKAKPRVCPECEHFWYRTAEADYSEVTPGNSFDMSCRKGMWLFDSFDVTPGGILEIFKAAQTCKFYTQIPSGEEPREG